MNEKEIAEMLLRLIDENYGYTPALGVSVEYVGQGSYTIRVIDRDTLVKLSEK